jgi:hypothetical protein
VVLEAARIGAAMEGLAMTPKATSGTTLWKEVQEVAAEWERDGWLRKFIKNGREWWELTPLGRRELAKENASQAAGASTR